MPLSVKPGRLVPTVARVLLLGFCTGCLAATGGQAELRLEGTQFLVGDAGGTHYYLAPGEGQRPLLVLIQGSGCEPVFVENGEGYRATAGQDLVHMLAGGRFAVLVAEKAGVEPLKARTGADGTAADCAAAFLAGHSLDSWTDRLSSAIDEAKASAVVDAAAGVRVMGLSEGAITAARLANLRDDVTHTAFISGFGCNQWRDMLVVARRNAEPEGALAARSAAAAMEDGLRGVAADPEALTIFEGQTHLFWSTFGRACPAADLAASASDVFVAYGTADEQVDANGVEAITVARLSVNKPVRVERVIGGSHVLNTPDTEPFEVLVGVFGAAIEWMSGDGREGN